MTSPRETLALAAFAIILSSAIVLLLQSPKIQAWERANGYPYGQMCNSLFTGFVDTCHKSAR